MCNHCGTGKDPTFKCTTYIEPTLLQLQDGTLSIKELMSMPVSEAVKLREERLRHMRVYVDAHEQSKGGS